ncbi:MAG: hypothetical protein L0271_00070 [Gemmatimonadetes bacterium]|nr:hypothetical protein [Gemmatimonadota bacterium]
MIELRMLQIPAIPIDLAAVAWAAAGLIGLLVLWEFATFLAYMLGLRQQERRRRS